MPKLARRSRLIVVPAVVAAFALSACQEEAPTAAPPSAPATPAATSTAPAAPTETAAPTQAPTTEQSAPTQAPTTQDGGGSGASGACNNTSSFKFTKGSVAPKPLSTPQEATYKNYGSKAQISIGQPTVDTSGGDSYFPGTGMQTVIYPVTIKMTSGSFFIVTRLGLGLVDASDTSCKQDTLNAVVPQADAFQVESLKPGDSISKKIGFAVPVGADLSKYSFVYSSDYNSGNAELAWNAK